MKLTIKLFYVLVGLWFVTPGIAQPGTSVDLKKPEQYENRTLASEKSGDKKLTAPKRFINNTFTHYNYYYNANTILAEIISSANTDEKTDYTKLLPFYPYSLDATAGNSNLDSIIYKCNAGILLHDLRSDWVDDMYFLMGKAYFYKKIFDTAGMVFRYINYAFAKKDDGYDIPIGSNASGNIFSISTDEKAGVFKKLTTKPPRRNEALLWLARNDFYENKNAEGAGILEILNHDPFFPDRLKEELSETLAYRYYLEKNYDSSAYHLSKTIDLSINKQDQARREYLIGQMYALCGQNENATKYFSRSADHSLDPIMAVYASLNAATVSIEDTTGAADEKIKSLQRLSQKERFRDYRDIIYYNIALAEMQNNNSVRAKNALKQSIKLSTKNPAQKSNSFLLLGDMNYDEGDFKEAANDYDSVDASSILDDAARARYMERAPLVRQIADNLNEINRQDSLQLIAKMPDAERTAFIKKTLRQLLKAQGIKDADAEAFINPAVQSSGDDLAAPQQNTIGTNNASNGEWYFNNQGLKTSGFQTFQSTWGRRPNIDNWNRLEAVSTMAGNVGENNNPDNDSDENNNDENVSGDESDSSTFGDDGSKTDNNDMIKKDSRLPGGNLFNKKPGVSPQLAIINNNEENISPDELSYDALLANIPTTDDKMEVSNNSIADALFENGQILQEQLKNYPASITMYQQLNSRFPDNTHLEESLFNLYYCYSKLGKSYLADSAKQALSAKFPDGEHTSSLNNKVVSKEEKANDPATKEYARIYDLFISGKFAEAEAAKKAADAQYDKSYWTPQLLYIESIYYVSTRKDSVAIDALTNLKDMYASTPLADKAETMIDVLNRRSEIESYLTNLDIKRYAPDEVSPIVNLNPVEQFVDNTKKETPKIDSVVSKPIAKQIVQLDTARRVITQQVLNYTFVPTDQHYFAIVLNAVAPVFINETKNAFNRYNATNFYNQKINASITKLNDTFSIVLLGPFTDASAALTYSDKVKPVAPTSIIPWLQASKYNFTIISDPNIAILTQRKDPDNYRQLIIQTLPGKF